ncbi:MAG: phosphoribosylaminoimidazolecarboxamide formyltransferase/IMP cyclohydrolase [Actinomycetota bacterium]
MPTALISVFDKSGVADLARTLVECGWKILSSGGTATALRNEGVPVTDVADLTGSGAILGHRVVTLHPSIHAGILADLSDPEHVADLERLGIEPLPVRFESVGRTDRCGRSDDGAWCGQESRPCWCSGAPR